MTGCHYWRCKRRLTLEALAQQSGCSTRTIFEMENRPERHFSGTVAAKVARALEVTMEELMATYPEDGLDGGDHPTYQWSMAGNLLNRYRQYHNLTYNELANRVGVKSRQHAHMLCRRRTPSKKILIRLAEYEGLTVEVFLHRYKETDTEAGDAFDNNLS